jgi:hypothetical protein
MKILLVALTLAAGACSDGKTYLLVRLDSAASITADRFVVSLDIAGTALTANAVFTPPSAVTLPPQQQLSLVLAGDPSGQVDVGVRAEAGGVAVANTSGSIQVTPHGTNTLSLSFGNVQPDSGTPPDLVTPPDMASVPPVSFDVTAPLATYKEHETFTLHMVAKNASGLTETGYHGTPSLTSSWGDVTSAAPPVFVNGVCDLAVSLNRETHPGFAGAILTVTEGTAMGNSSEITVTVDDWHVDGSAYKIYISYTKSLMTLPEAAHPGAIITAGSGSGYELIFDTTVHMGGPTGAPSIAIFSSPDGLTWTRAGGYLAGSDSAGSVSATSILWDGTQYHALWTGTDAAAATHLVGASSPDALSWTAETPVASNDFKCASATNGFLFGAGSYHRLQATGPVCNVDGTGVSTENTGMLTSGAPWSGYVIEGTVHKIWSVSGGQTYYQTSSDGINWVSSSAAWPAVIYAAYWNNERKQIEGLIDQNGDSHYWRIYRQ